MCHIPGDALSVLYDRCLQLLLVKYMLIYIAFRPAELVIAENSIDNVGLNPIE